MEKAKFALALEDSDGSSPRRPPGRPSSPVHFPDHPVGTERRQKHLSTDEGLLAFHKGDLITVKKRRKDGWFIGQIGSKLGSFPTSKVLLLLSKPTKDSGTSHLASSSYLCAFALSFFPRS